jgi:hypothetical protein
LLHLIQLIPNRMKGLHRYPQPANGLFAFLLALSLLLTQGFGLHHRVSHAGLERATHLHSTSNAGQTNDQHGDITHSCLAFDAATLGASLHSDTGPQLPAIGIIWFQPGFAFISWQAALLRRFSSRAPPLV